MDKIKGKIDYSTIIFEDFRISFSVMGGTIRLKAIKEMEDFNNSIKQLDTSPNNGRRHILI